MVTETYLVRHFLSIQQFLEDGELENAYWIPGTENPADGLTKLRSEMGPIMALLETGRFQPGVLRPPKGLASRECWCILSLPQFVFPSSLPLV